MQKEIKAKKINELFRNEGQLDGVPANPRFIRDDSYLELKKSILVFPNMLFIDTIAYAERGVILGGNQRHAVLTEIFAMSNDEIKTYLEETEEFLFKTEENRKQILNFWKSFLKTGEVPAQDISDLSLEEKLEFVFKDNRSYGETDWNVIDDEWNENLEMVYKWSGERPFNYDDDGDGDGAGDSEEPERGKLSDRFIINPFSVLDARTGTWQDRKRFWQSLGIKSEIGRGDDLSITALTPSNYDEKKKLEKELDRKLSVKEYKSLSTKKLISSTSIFDPTLCELNYKWFCPDGGEILDPFAGGSVRGIIANYLGFKYTGIDIRPEQVESNREQGTEILGAGNEPTWITGDSNEELDKISEKKQVKTIKISGKQLLQKFQRCEPEYIKNVCHGRCCEGTGKILVTVHDSEVERFKQMGAKLDGNFIKADAKTGKCPFKENDLCSIHENKPFGCKASPFTINPNDTLIVRNRYRLLKCYNTPEAVPAYEAHNWSLRQIFGDAETERIIEEVKAGNEDIYAEISFQKYRMLIENDDYKQDRQGRQINDVSEKFDFIFSCPPYGDLEVYSDLDGDISNLKYEEFIDRKSVV